MQLCHSRPKVSTVTVVGTGAALLNPIATLTNGRPKMACRLRWLSAAAPAITDVVKIQIVFTAPFQLGLLAQIGLRILDAAGIAKSAEGLKFSFMAKKLITDSGFAYALGGNSALQRAIQRNDNSVVVAVVPQAGLDPIIGLEMTIWNDIGALPAIVTSGFLDLGDFWASPSFDAEIDGDWKISFPKNNNAPDSTDDQPWPATTPPGRMLNFARRLITFSDAFVGGAVPCWERIRTICGNGLPIVAVPRYGTVASLDATSLHKTLVYGKFELDQISRIDGDKFNVTGTVSEVPALNA
jgi:hypothetical protein